MKKTTTKKNVEQKEIESEKEQENETDRNISHC